MKVERTMKVAAILAARPDLRWTLVAGGIAGLADENHHPAAHVTIEYAAGRHGADADALVTALNQALKEKSDMGIIKAIKKKVQEHKGGCCHCGGHATHSAEAKPVKEVKPAAKSAGKRG
jgi:hypothetical protein